MRSDYRVHICEPDRGGVAIVRGVNRELLAGLQIHGMWSPTRRGCVIRKDSIPDVIAKLEHAHALVRFHAKEPKR